jgi:hypothetical protein
MRKLLGICVLAGASVLPVGLAVAGQSPAERPAVLYRVFLLDGSTLVSYGEPARVGERVIFAVPIGDVAAEPELELLTLAAGDIDWPATERYADAARASHYAATRGDSDFTHLSADIARALNEVALSTDPAHRLAVAEAARRALRAWPQRHYNYRASDIHQLSLLVDEVVQELRAEAGAQRFDLDLVATIVPAPEAPLLPPPGVQESPEAALAAARRTEEPAERLSLLGRVLAFLERAGGSLPAFWAGAMEATASAELAAELRIERAYAALTASTLAQAARRAARADVRGVERLVQQARERDAALGRQRTREMAALFDALDERLEAARWLRLAQDQWAERDQDYRRYRAQMAPALRELRRARPHLEEIRALAGPSMRALTRLEVDVARAQARWAASTAPAELQPAHALLGSALRLIEHAGALRQQAVTGANMPLAWNASSAAAGALLLSDRALEDLDRQMKRPELP